MNTNRREFFKLIGAGAAVAAAPAVLAKADGFSAAPAIHVLSCAPDRWARRITQQLNGSWLVYYAMPIRGEMYEYAVLVAGEPTKLHLRSIDAAACAGFDRARKRPL